MARRRRFRPHIHSLWRHVPGLGRSRRVDGRLVVDLPGPIAEVGLARLLQRILGAVRHDGRNALRSMSWRLSGRFSAFRRNKLRDRTERAGRRRADEVGS